MASICGCESCVEFADFAEDREELFREVLPLEHGLPSHDTFSRLFRLIDPQARLYRKGDGQPAKLAWLGHVLMENRNGLIVDAELTQATGWAERAAAEAMIETVAPGGGVTLGADRAYDAASHVANLRAQGVTPHVAQNTSNRRSAIDGRTTRHAGYAISQRIRKRIEEPFGWIKEAGGFRQTKHRGRDRVRWMFTLRAAAYNLIRLPTLLAAT